MRTLSCDKLHDCIQIVKDGVQAQHVDDSKGVLSQI